MSQYSIRDLELLSGIKAHTLRIWEQRYQLLKPTRSDTNIRTYDTEQMLLLLNVILLLDHGHKISNIAKLSTQQIESKVIEITDQQLNYPDQIQILTTAMLELDEARFENILAVNIEKFGFENVMNFIIYPFLTKIGSLWITGAVGPAEEHFMTHLIRQKLIVSIDKLPFQPKINHKTFILYLPEGEYHEIGLLFAYYIFKSHGHKVFYLGQSLPQADLLYVSEKYKPNFIFTCITSMPGQDKIQQYLDWMSEKFPNTNILVTGYQVVNKNLNLGKNITAVSNVEEMQKIVNLIG
jgi:MerR family transcriptional regulator, light-induced transcriptional regulator